MRLFQVLLTTFLIGGTLQCYSQATPKVIPPSPNAMEFQKYGNIPVSYHSGIPQITVPVYDVKSKDVSFSINLSYHASGIKVNDEASKVGLGWALNSGGVITRSIMGGDDFQDGNGTYAYHTNSVPELPQNIPGILSGTDQIQNGCTVNFFGVSADFHIYDTQPDQYTYTLPGGKSGKFILKRNKDVILSNDEKIDIKVLDQNGQDWQIRTSDGFTYEFKMSEEYHGNDLVGSGTHRTAWYLTKIKSPTGTIVTFEYTKATQYLRPVGSLEETNTVYTVGRDEDSGGYSGDCEVDPNVYTSTPGREYSNVQLDRIVFNEGYLKFTYSNRLDIYQDQKLDRIEIFAKKSAAPETFELLKQNSFVYEYFEGEGDGDYGTLSEYAKRLKLKRIIEMSPADQTSYDYKFEYQDEDGDKAWRPYKTSFARDHWGYYNGKTSNTSLIPTFHSVLGSNLIRNAVGVMGDERDAIPAVTDLFALKRIWYPTGGYTEFEFECHDFDVPNSFVNDQSFFNYNPEGDLETRTIMIDGDPAGPNPPNFYSAKSQDKVLDVTQGYTDPGNNVVSVNYNIFFLFNSNTSNTNFSGHHTTFELVRADGTVIYTGDIFDLLSDPVNPSALVPYGSGSPQQYMGIRHTGSFGLTPGKYFVRITVPPTITMFSTVSSTFNYIKRNAFRDYGGGLRVKRIKSYDAPTSAPSVTRFIYNYQEDRDNDTIPETYSYGRRMTNPQYCYYERKVTQRIIVVSGEAIVFRSTCEQFKRTNRNLVSTVNGGSPVSYDKVIVYHGENGENGKSVFSYHNVPDLTFGYTQSTMMGPIASSVPRRPPAFSAIAEPLTGSLLKQEDYKYMSTGNFELVRSTTNTYADGHNPLASVVWAIDKRQIATPDIDCRKYDNYIFPVMRSTNVNLIRTIESTTSQSDINKAIVKESEFYYENPAHFLLTKQVDITNLTRSVVTTYKYAADYPDVQCSPSLLAMKNALYMPAAPVEKKITELTNGMERVLSHNITTYGLINSNSIAVPLSQVALLRSVPQLSANIPAYVPASGHDANKYRTLFSLNYFPSANIKSIQPTDNTVTSYLWGYQDRLPIAEVSNALPEHVFYTSFEDFGEGNSSDYDSKTGVKSKTGGYTNTVTGLASGDYILTYWTKVSGAWTFSTQPVTVSGSSYAINLSGQVDEVRFYPKAARMKTFTHVPLVGMLEAIDENNRVTKYTYDSFKRLQTVVDDSGDIVRYYTYKFKSK